MDGKNGVRKYKAGYSFIKTFNANFINLLNKQSKDTLKKINQSNIASSCTLSLKPSADVQKPAFDADQRKCM